MELKAIMLNRQVLLALGMIVFVGAVVASSTGAFFSSQAAAVGNTFAAGTLDLQLTQNQGGGSPQPTQTAQWDFANMAPGGTPDVSSVWLRNVGSVDGASLGVAIPGGWTNPSNIAAQMRITEMTLDGNNLLVGGAGASIPEYEAPVGCDTTVAGSGLLIALNAASAGEVICVDTGNYTPGTVTVVAPNVTVVGLNDPDSADRAFVTGTIVAGADGLTVRGLAMSNPDGRTVVQAANVNGLTVTENVIENVGTNSAVVATGGVQAVYIQGGGSPISDFEVSYNQFSNIGNASLSGSSPNGSSAKAIYVGDTATGGGVDDVEVSNNIIATVRASNAPFASGGRGAYGFLTNHQTVTNLVVENNSISDLSGWWEQGVSLFNSTPGAIVRLNDMSDFASASGAGVNVESNVSASTVVIEENNFADTVASGVLNQTALTVTAQNNWWGGFTTTEVNTGGGSVDTSNFAGGPFAGLVNGNDFNGNGYADLHDLRNDPITGITPGLDAYNGSNDKEFVMAVQLDGPTTGNTFQGLSLEDVDIEFTLNQI